MKKVRFWGAIGIFIIILMRPQEAIAAAQRAMGVWYTSVAPALFPFLALMPLFTNEEACAAYEIIFSKYMRALFGLPGAAAPAVVVGMIAGSPGGAIALRRVAANSSLNSAEARRIAMALSGVSPAYLIMGVGQGLYGSTSLGMKLAGIQICIQLLLMILLPRGKKHEAEMTCRPEVKTNMNPILTAVESLLGICGYMVLFGIIAAVMASFVGDRTGSIMLLALDLPSGLANLMNMQPLGKMVLLGAAIGFGGVCIAYQNMDIHRDVGLNWKDYLMGRGIAASMYACACIGLEGSVQEKMQNVFGNNMKSYAVALLLAGFMVFPALYFLSRKWFLNNQKCGDDQA